MDSLTFKLQAQARLMLEEMGCPQGGGQLRESFAEFCQRVEAGYKQTRLAAALTNAMQRVVDGEILNLVLVVPPQHGKSLHAAQLLPSYYLSRNPRQWASIITYGSDLALRNSREARNYYASSGAEMARDSASVGTWQTAARGGCWATSVGGQITGKSTHLAIADDLVKDQQEALSASTLQYKWEWFTGPTYRTRLQQNGRRVLMHTRWAEGDPIGRLIKFEKEEAKRKTKWHVLDLPAIFPEKDDRAEYYPEHWEILPDWRSPGEPLCPELHDLDSLLDIQESMGSFWWSALYMGRPVPAAGGLFKSDWWQWYDQIPDARVNGTIFDCIVLAVDCTFKANDDSDFVAAVVIGKRGADFYVLDVLNERLTFTDTVRAVRMLTARWKPTAVLVEDAANGAAVVDTLKREIYGLIPVSAAGGKLARAAAVSPVFESMHVWLPSFAPWRSAFTGQFATFPKGQNDDMVDATTHAINYLVNLYRSFNVSSGGVQWAR